MKSNEAVNHSFRPSAEFLAEAEIKCSLPVTSIITYKSATRLI